MIHSMLLGAESLERVCTWAESTSTDLRILQVLYETKWDSYVVVVDCSERDATFLSLLEV